jgi:hypothetical protein
MPGSLSVCCLLSISDCFGLLPCLAVLCLAGADVGQLFADAALEKTRKLPYYTSSTQQQQQQRRLRRQVIDNSSTAWQYLPPECDAATNTCSNWGLTHSKAIGAQSCSAAVVP